MKEGKKMRKNSKFLVMLLCVLMVTALAAFAGCTKEEPAPAEPPAGSSITEPEPEPEPEPPAASGDLSDDPYSFTAMLDGVVYTLPAPFSEFAANGWAIDEEISSNPSPTEEIEPDSYASAVVVKNGDHQMSMDFVNTDVNTLSMTECNIGALSLYSYAEKGAELVLPASITLGSTIEEVLAAYGEPSYKNESETIFKYSGDSYAEIGIDFDAETKLANGLRIRNLIPKEVAPEYTGDAPAVVTSYEQPAALGDSWDSYTAKYGGVLYKLPVPVSVLMENGWEGVDDVNTMVDGKGYLIGFQLRNGNQVLRTSVTNYDGNQQPAKYCFVTKIEYYDNGAQVPIELPKGVSEKSSIDDFIKAYGQPDETDDSSTMFRRYTWGESFEGLGVSVSIEENIITHITLEYSPRELG